MKEKKLNFQVLLISLFYVAFIYTYPRILLNFFSPENPWCSYLYIYGNGIVFFSIGIHLILKSKACVFGRSRDSFWFKILIFGLVFFASLHGLWIYSALTYPVFKG